MIDPDKFSITDMSSKDIEDLASDLYHFIEKMEVSNLYRIKERFPMFNDPKALEIIQELLSQGVFEYCPKGIRIKGDPKILSGGEIQFDDSIGVHSTHISETTVEEVSEVPPFLVNDPDYLLQLEQMEDRISKHLRTMMSVEHEDSIVSKIMAMGESLDKDILIECFVNMTDHETVFESSSRAESTIAEFCATFECDPRDVEYFTTYDIPANLFIYIFDRSPAYYRMLLFKYDSGPISPEVLIERAHSMGLTTPKSPESHDLTEIYERFEGFISSYIVNNSEIPQNMAFIEAYLFMFNNYLVSTDDLFKYYYKIFTERDELTYERDALGDPILFNMFISNKRTVKYISLNDIHSLISYLLSTFEIKYATTIKKIFNKNRGEIQSYGIDDLAEFKQFIDKYSSFEYDGEHICFGDSLSQSITNYMLDSKIYERDRVAEIYSKKFGGDKRSLLEILSTVETSKIIQEDILSDDELSSLEKEFDNYEWVSAINAESIFSDKCGLKQFFNNYNMHKLGFVSSRDVYYRDSYSNFRECLRANEFSGDDIYIDNMFRIKMESESFQEVRDYLVTNLMWIPVSESRYVNLRSERFKDLYDNVKKYVVIVKKMCEEQFITPFLLKNTPTGIEEIDDDDYDLIFYDAILYATKTNRSSISDQHFYHQNSAVGDYRCVVPDFLRYVISKNGNMCEVNELREILKSDYGIDTSISRIRQNLSLSECIFSKETDTAYFDSETFKGAVKNEWGDN